MTYYRVVQVSAWLAYRGYITFERYLDASGEPLPMVPGLFHCERRHAISPQDLAETRELVRLARKVEYTGVGPVLLLYEPDCPRCRVQKGLTPYDRTGPTNQDPPPGISAGDISA